MVAPINALEAEMEARSDAELRELTDVFRQRLEDGEEDLDDLLPEAFATVREASRRILGKRHFDVQLVGGAALHWGQIAEMRTGEGKTLVATLPAYLNALTGEGVHIITVNDYLAKRDAEWMGAIYRFLGLEVGVTLATMTPWERRPNYAADITHGTNNEFGFDYLRDNMALSTDELVQRGHNFAIVDEVDSILVDEARTPLIISGPAEQGARWYQQFARIAPRMRRDVHYEVDEGKHTVAINEEGVATVEQTLGIENLYDSLNTPLVQHLQNAVRAQARYERDAPLIAQTGRLGAVTVATNMAGRGVDIMLGGNVEYLAQESLRINGINPDEMDPEAWSQALQSEVEIKTGEVAAEHDKVVQLGGLCVLGTERHESRRIDNQLRGRSGRQGDPGESRFFLSLEDDLMRMFATKTVASL